MQSLRSLLGELPADQRPTLEVALEFLFEHGARTKEFYGYGPYVIGEAAGLINYNFGRKGAKPQHLAGGWLNRHELAARTNQSLERIDEDLRSLDWATVRPHLEGIRTAVTDEESNITSRERARVHVLWSRPRSGEKLILPHYNPAIVEHLEELAERRRAAASVPGAADAPRPES
jgi:hypothetical protein